MRKGVTEEQEKRKQKLENIFELVGLKQEQTLIRYLFYPFWRALVATATLLTGVLLANGSWVLSGGTIAVICFGFYMCLKLRARLKILNSLF